jgi:hypothetical protein
MRAIPENGRGTFEKEFFFPTDRRPVQPFAAGAAKGCTAWFMVLMHDLRGTPDSSGSSGPRATLPDKSGVPSRFTVTMRDYRVWRLGGNV